MKAIQVNVVPDEEVPQFKRLQFTSENVSLRELLINGYHPLVESRYHADRYPSGYYQLDKMLIVTMEHLLNKEENFIKATKQFSTRVYCSSGMLGRYGTDIAEIPAAMKNLEKRLYLVGEYSHDQVVALARKHLSKNWNNRKAQDLLMHISGNFNDTRNFLKQFDKNIILKAWADIGHIDVSKIFTVDQIEGHDNSIIYTAFDCPNFRKTDNIEQFTTNGYVSFIDRINQFSLHAEIDDKKLAFIAHLTKDDRIHVTPNISYPEDRVLYKRFVKKVTNKEAYCMDLSIEEVEKMLGFAKISFPLLKYEKKMEQQSSSAVFRGDLGPELYRLGTIIDKDYTNKTLADVLQSYDEKVSGTKKELLNRIADIVVKLYKKHKKQLDHFFKTPYLKLNCYYYQSSRPTTIIDTGIDAGCLSQMVVAAYVAKHLRAERVLSSQWENTSYNLKDLISSIINGDISVNYNFIKI